MQARQLALITDLYQLQARTDTLRTELIDSENNARIALEKLRELTGDAVTRIQPARLDIVQPPPDGRIDTWVQQAGRLTRNCKRSNTRLNPRDEVSAAIRQAIFPVSNCN